MEKIEWLIDKLKRQSEAGNGAAAMLATLQLLQSELNLLLPDTQSQSKNVSVVLPAPRWNNHADDELDAYETSTIRSADEEKVVFELEPFVHEQEEEKATQPTEAKDTPPENHSAYLPEKKETISPVEAPNNSTGTGSGNLEKILASPLLPIEAVEMKNPDIQAGQRSLNDLLEKPADELFNRLHEPIKDLKKAISINDRYQYITNLFSGDEAMYDRSIKTINSFNIFSEAEYWIRRELAVKHGWRDNDPLVKGFYHLVSRRFS